MKNNETEIYKSLYYYLFNRITDMIERLEMETITPETMVCICELKDIQIKAEEIYIERENLTT